ncbi:oxygenase MpaB family protein [soil metagenome]
MRITRADFEAGIALVERDVSDPRGGIYGRDSISWTVGRESALFLSAGSASLLQLAHPYVAHAIAAHSRTRSDPMKRFQRTFFHVYRVGFGDLARAVASARQIFSVHEHIRGTIGEDLGRYQKGTTYEALDPDALYWVYATLVHGSLSCFELFVRELSQDERERYVKESHRFALLFGVPASMLPRSYAAFMKSWAEWVSSDRLAVGTIAKDISHFLLHPPRRIPRAIALSFRPITRALLPPKIREGYGGATFADGAFLSGARWLSKTAYAALPSRLRFVPAYHDAQRRLAGDGSREAVGRWFHRRALKVVLGPG